MTLTESDLLAAVQAGEIAEKIRTSLAWVLQQLIDAELTAVIGAGPHERTETRTNRSWRPRPGCSRMATRTKTIPTMPAPSGWPACAPPRPAGREDYSAVMGMWSDRYLELSGARTQVVCRLHALLCEFVPGGFLGVLRATAAQKVLKGIDPATPADHARLALAWQLLGDLERIDEQRRETKKHMDLAVARRAPP